MKILAYRGKSLVSKAIRFQTRSPYSHIAVELDDGSVIEAWHKGGVVHRKHYREGHTPGTPVDFYEISGDFDIEEAERFLKMQVGLKYDFVSVFRFVSRRKSPSNKKYFCSELAEYAFMFAGLPLLNGNPSEHSPRDTVMSPYLNFEKTCLT